MQIISELEQTARGPMRAASAIFLQRQSRHLHHHPHRADQGRKAYVQAGGGWVNDSTPEAEFQETVNKSMAMRKAVALAKVSRKVDQPRNTPNTRMKHGLFVRVWRG